MRVRPCKDAKRDRRPMRKIENIVAENAGRKPGEFDAISKSNNKVAIFYIVNRFELSARVRV